MQLKTLCLVGATLISLAVPAAASADPHWRDRDDWRRHEWREHGRWDHRPWAWGWYGGPRCVVEPRGYYDWYGRYIYRPVRVCYP